VVGFVAGDGGAPGTGTGGTGGGHAAARHPGGDGRWDEPPAEPPPTVH
jgi:hypothetical protein